MKTPGRDALRDLLLLSFTAGSADAAGYMGPGHVFTSNMTGNVVLFGIAVGQGHLREAIHTVYVLAVFFLAALSGSWMSHRVKGKTWAFLAVRVIGVEAILLTAFAVLWYRFSVTNTMGHAFYPLITVLGMAMGLQSSAMNRLSVPGVVTTAITGTLTSLARGITAKFAARVEASDPGERPAARVEFQASVVGFYCAGAVLSGYLVIHRREWVGLAPALLSIFIVLRQAQALRRENG